MRVLHVSEAMGGGVTSAVLAMVEATPDIDHHLLARPRTQHDTGADLAEVFSSVHLLPGQPLGAVRALRRLERELFPDVLHAHSSFGGLLARVAGWSRSPIAYSPHCFAFERRDIGSIRQRLFAAVERALAPRTDLLLAVAPHEIDLAATLGYRQVDYVPNRTTVGTLGSARYSTSPRVVTVGRICAQKDWRYFLHLKRYVDRQVDVPIEWVWLGGGDTDGEAALRAAGVRVSGWMSRDELTEELAQAQAYVHTAAWEAAPISIFEAAELGLPLVLRSIAALDSLYLPGLSGSVVQMSERLTSLLGRDAWQQAQHDSLSLARRHSHEQQGTRLRAAYQRLLPERTVRHLPPQGDATRRPVLLADSSNGPA